MSAVVLQVAELFMTTDIIGLEMYNMLNLDKRKL